MKYFKMSDFDSKDAPGSGANMRLGTVLKLDDVRSILGKPVIVKSGYRTPAYSELLKKQGYQVAKKSAHLSGYAVDIRPKEGLEADLTKWAAFLDALWKAGFRRFGIMGGAVHVDDDPGKVSPAIWRYNTTNNTVWAMAQNWFEKKAK